MNSVAILLVLVGTFQLGYGQMFERKCNMGSWNYLRIMGFSDQVCVWYSPEKATFIDAVSWCDKIDGANLAELPSPNANTLVMATVPSHMKGKKFWIGLTDTENEGIFLWFNKKRAAYYNRFAPGQGTSRDRAKNCVYLDSAKGLWYVDSCLAQHYYMCAK